ncbi:MAG: hypothetical protein V3U37_04265 [Nitrospinaceae bacterium]
MFYEVRIFDAEGQLKKTISSKRLSNRFWKKNENSPPEFGDSDSNSEMDAMSMRGAFSKKALAVDDSLD